jgi:hypothetical protein
LLPRLAAFSEGDWDNHLEPDFVSSEAVAHQCFVLPIGHEGYVPRDRVSGAWSDGKNVATSARIPDAGGCGYDLAVHGIVGGLRKAIACGAHHSAAEVLAEGEVRVKFLA